MNRYEFYSSLQNYKKNDELKHYGILGQKWGNRRWQNQDGTFNEEGKERYFGKNNELSTDKLRKEGYIENDEFNLDEINNHMHEDFKYDDSDHKLQSSQETFDKKTGNCHDQVLFEIDMLKKNGYDPKAVFLMEVDPKTGEGGQTHSFVYYSPYGNETDPNKTINWFENAWQDKAGIRSYPNFNELKKDIEKDFGTDKNKYSEIVWGEFEGEPGDDLQDIIDKSLKKEL